MLKSIEIARSGGKTVSWGSGKKEVLRIFEGIEKELANVAVGTSCMPFSCRIRAAKNVCICILGRRNSSTIALANTKLVKCQ
jgi:hypothetical protein